MLRSERLLWVLFALYLTFLGGASYYNTIFAVRVFHHVVMSLVLALWLWRCARVGGLPALPLNGALLILASYWGVNALLAVDPRMAFEHVWFGLLHLLLFWLLVERMQRGRQRMLFEAVFVMASLVLFITLLELGSWYFGWGILPNTQVGWLVTGELLPPLALLPRTSLAMTVSTLLGGYAAPLAVLAIVWARSTSRRDYRVVLWGMACALAIVVLLSRSRGGMLSLGVGTGAFALYHLFTWAQARSAKLARAVLAGGAAVGALAILAFVWLTLPQGEAGVSNAGRRDMWQSALAITADHPLFGVGYGMFGRVFREYRQPDIAQDQLASAHNLYLNTLSETGIVGATIAGFVALQGLRVMRRRWLGLPRGTRRTRYAGVAAAMLGVAAHSVVDVFTVTPIVFLLLVMTAYLLVEHPPTLLARPVRHYRVAAWAFLAVVLSYGAALLVWDSAQGYFMASLRSETATDALANARTAQAIDPQMRLYALHEAFVLAWTGANAADVALKSALALEPTWDIGWAHLAAWHEQRGDTQTAFDALSRALAIQPRSPLQVAWARLAESSGFAEDSAIIAAYVRGIREGLRTTRTLPISGFWRATPLRQAALQQWIATQPLDVQYAVLRAHAPDQAAALVSDTPQSAAAWWIAGMDALAAGDTERAQTAFAQAIALAPRRGDYHASYARAVHADDAQAAAHALDLARLYGTLLEVPDAIAAAWRGETYEPSPLAIRQEFAAVLYSRPALFAPPPAYDYPR